jgi:hypothetical protein
MKQALHWSKLPEFHATIETDIPIELISYDFPVIGRILIKLRSLGKTPHTKTTLGEKYSG